MEQPIIVERSIWIDAPQERVWRAITDVAEIRQWWGGDHWEFSSLEVGATIQFGDPNDPMIATIDVVDPPRQFVILWPPQDQYHSIQQRTIYLLTEENGGTLVTVQETGFEALPDDDRQEQIERTGNGYKTVLTSLKALLEQEKT
ncbi:SRPBCC domain-containing protein [Phototrophicus methaneseepsis]|uniref:SRPBCC domain-containing protein n=1 Tax=Phototrophicus methaneseepsis TaxID=2710758 RepID=A0A7S8IG50_9CHLR|nr:SRPBCC domain-containing protein [Phototrophicus methaneseepsis]QPC84194.1 SRPBCC domain-containing protein [Phototrophicus methaneseepsis]